jgi:hypothetical protein
MCFCAEASFGAAALLAVTGLFAYKQATKKSQYMIAGIPLIFAVQQAAEGVLWITDKQYNLLWLHIIAAYFFLLCAFVIWPTWIPLTFKRYDTTNNTLFTILTWLGLFISGSLCIFLLIHPVVISTEGYHVLYSFGLPHWLGIMATFIYALPILVPFFVCHNRLFKIMGAMLLAAAVVSWYSWYVFFTSIWCFFAALLSVFILVIISFDKE